MIPLGRAARPLTGARLELRSDAHGARRPRLPRFTRHLPRNQDLTRSAGPHPIATPKLFKQFSPRHPPCGAVWPEQNHKESSAIRLRTTITAAAITRQQEACRSLWACRGTAEARCLARPDVQSRASVESAIFRTASAATVGVRPPCVTVLLVQPTPWCSPRRHPPQRIAPTSRHATPTAGVGTRTQGVRGRRSASYGCQTR